MPSIHITHKWSGKYRPKKKSRNALTFHPEREEEEKKGESRQEPAVSDHCDTRIASDTRSKANYSHTHTYI